jgi:hypothetical protein
MVQQPLADHSLVTVDASRSHSDIHTTLGTTPLDELWAPHRDLFLAIHNNHNRQIPITPAGFEHAIPPSERPQTHVLDRVTTGISIPKLLNIKLLFLYN